MPCPLCLKHEISYSYSGGSVPLEDFSGCKTLVRTFDAQYPNMRFEELELDECQTCGALWLKRFHFPDHPPIMLFADVLDTPEKRQRAQVDLLASLKRQHEAGMIESEQYEKTSRDLQRLGPNGSGVHEPEASG